MYVTSVSDLPGFSVILIIGGVLLDNSSSLNSLRIFSSPFIMLNSRAIAENGATSLSILSHIYIMILPKCKPYTYNGPMRHILLLMLPFCGLLAQPTPEPSPLLSKAGLTIAQLPAPTVANTGWAARIINGNSVSDCTVGGGATSVWCFSTGTSWMAMNGGASGTGTVTSTTCNGSFGVNWLTCTFGGSTTVTPVLQLSPATGQTSHKVIGTCGSATTFAPCSLVAEDIPSLNYQAPITLTTTGTSGATTLIGNTLNVPIYAASGFISSVTGTSSQITATTTGGAVALSIPSPTVLGSLTATGGLTGGVAGTAGCWNFYDTSGTSTILCSPNTFNGYLYMNGTAIGSSLGLGSILVSGAGILYPATDSTTAVRICNNALSNCPIDVDTTHIRFGIATSTPAQTLEVGGAGLIDGTLILGTTAGTGIVTPANDGTSGVQICNNAKSHCPLDVDTTNYRVGIGTNTPSTTMEVNGSTAIDGTILPDQAATTITGTSGTTSCYSPVWGSALKIAICTLVSYNQTSTAQTFTFPTTPSAFNTAPLLQQFSGSSQTACGTYNATTTTTVLTLPANAAMTAQSCTIMVTGR